MGFENLWRRFVWHFFAGEKGVREKVSAFESLLASDRDAHDSLAELEEIFYGHSPVDLTAVFSAYSSFSGAVKRAATGLNRLTENRHTDLESVFSRLDRYARFFLEPAEPPAGPPYIISLEDIRPNDIDRVGAKAEALQRISKELDIPVPRGFVITTGAVHRLEEANRLRKAVDTELRKIRPEDPTSLNKASETLQKMVAGAIIPEEIAAEIAHAAEKLLSRTGAPETLALRSSAVGEDSAASFAGQYWSLLNVHPANIFDSYRQVLAGKYSPQALFYRIHQGLWDTETPMAVLVMEMIEARTAGVVYTRDPRKEVEPSIRIHASAGPGEHVVGGRTSPDLMVFSAEDPPKLRRRRLRSGEKPAMEPSTAEQLARMSLRIENAFGKPQDIEWCINQDNRIVFLQARPLRMPRPRTKTERECRFENVKNQILIEGGETASPGIGAGPVQMVEQADDLQRMPEGSVLVAHSALPELASVMGRVRAVVTDKGSSAGHLATVAREFGIPALVNTGDGSTRLRPKMDVTVNADDKKVFEGLVTEMIESPCAEGLTPEDTPFMRRMSALMSFVTPLSLTDPEMDNFTPGGCRSLHDVLRFVHETAVEAMFSLSERKVKAFRGAQKLRPGIPMLFYVLDVDGGLATGKPESGELGHQDVACKPLRSLIRGLKHPDIQWGPFHHFDWKAHDKTAMGGTDVAPDSAIYASHAVISEVRMNLNMKFGYHFVLLDAHYPTERDAGHLLFRFSGGGADMEQRKLRALFLKRILQRSGFSVRQRSDLVNGNWESIEDAHTMDSTLDLVGRLLGATRLMDMRLKDEQSVDRRIEEFFAGRYDFSNTP